MKVLSLATLVVAFSVAAPAQAGTPVSHIAASKHEHRCEDGRWDHRRLLRKSVRFGVNQNGANYWAKPITSGKRELERMRRCQKRAGNRDALKQMRADWRGRMKRWRFHRRIDLITPYGAWAIPSYIVFRESRYNRCARNSYSTAGGYYQFIDSTWYSLGGRNYGGRHPAACAPAWHQHEIAARAWNGGAGASHWAATL